MFWSALIIGFVLALIIVLLGIYYVQKTQRENEIRAYENALMSSEPAVLQNFLDMYIEAPVAHRDSIKVHLQALMKIDRDWENARVSLSKSALQLFIDRNPDNVHVREARMMIDSLDFESARMLNTMESYKKYLEEHEQGYYYDEAKSEYDRLEQEMIRAAQIKAEQDSIKAAEEAAAAATTTIVEYSILLYARVNGRTKRRSSSVSLMADSGSIVPSDGCAPIWHCCCWCAGIRFRNPARNRTPRYGCS